jgi:UDP-N-acetylmuramoylalanine--D-glutamate ligase
MRALMNKSVLVAGLALSGRAACRLLLRQGARVTGFDSADTPELRREMAAPEFDGVKLSLGRAEAPGGDFDLVVISPGVPLDLPALRALQGEGVPVIGELELGYQHVRCLNAAVTGTNGKTTTTELVAAILTHCNRKTIAAGNIGLPVCAVADQSRDLDILTLEVSSFQLETIQFFRPSVAVLLNITPDHLDRYATMADYTRAKARIFANQQAFDWAVVQSEALARIRSLGLNVPSKVITFSARNRRADLYLDRGLLVSRLPDWTGPLLDMDRCQLRGPHNAENLMAALAVGRVLRLPLESMLQAVREFRAGPHRLELVAEIGGVRFINDSKATNLDATRQALLSCAPARAGAPNVWLIAGGKDKGFEYHDLGPLLSERVKGAFLIGETREKIRAAWSLFTSCAPVDSLLQAVAEAAKNAVSGDVVLLSPACSSFDQFQNYERRGEKFREAVERFARSVQPSNEAGQAGIPGSIGMSATHI